VLNEHKTQTLGIDGFSAYTKLTVSIEDYACHRPDVNATDADMTDDLTIHQQHMMERYRRIDDRIAIKQFIVPTMNTLFGGLYIAHEPALNKPKRPKHSKQDAKENNKPGNLDLRPKTLAGHTMSSETTTLFTESVIFI
jgi:hypothetical protein